MGDIIEFVTLPSHGRMCFKITSSGVNFDIQTSGYATVGLSRKPGRKYDVLVTIGTNNMSWIGENSGDRVQASTPDILSGDEYSRFWILWTANFVSFGKYGHVEPILKYPSKSPKCMYASFLTYEGFYSVHWKVELPPTLKQPPLKPIAKGDLHWVSVDKQLPDDALIGGFEKETLFIIRAKHRGSLAPGKFVPSEGTGYIAWGGEAHEKENFEVLCGYNCEWVATGDDRIPVGAIEAGHSEVNREVLYVGRALCGGYNIPGKVQPSHRVCYVPYKGKEVAVEYYEILTVPNKWPCVNKYILPNDDTHHHVPILPNEAFNEEDDDFAPVVNEYWVN